MHIDEIVKLKSHGFEVVMSNRPDGEEPGQPLADDIRAAVEGAGMEFIHIPIISGQFTQEAADQFGEVVSKYKKVFAYCRTGTRSAALWALSQADNLSADEILEATASAGYDLPQLRGFLESK